MAQRNSLPYLPFPRRAVYSFTKHNPITEGGVPSSCLEMPGTSSTNAASASSFCPFSHKSPHKPQALSTQSLSILQASHLPVCHCPGSSLAPNQPSLFIQSSIPSSILTFCPSETPDFLELTMQNFPVQEKGSSCVCTS